MNNKLLEYKGMKQFILLMFLMIPLFSCEKDCTEKQGKVVEQAFEVSFFENIIVYKGVELHIIKGNQQSVLVKTGENKLDNIYFNVKDNTLEIEADVPCMLSPDYDPIIVFVTTPNLKILRNAGSHTIYSGNILKYNELTLISENFQNTKFFNNGNFNLTLQTQNLKIVSNGVSNFFVTGTTNELQLYYYGGMGKFEGKNLIANHVNFYHRGENTLKIHPTKSLIGDFYSTGDILSYYQPEVVNVTQHYTGKLIYK